jgi:hypothetical protein
MGKDKKCIVCGEDLSELGFYRGVEFKEKTVYCCQALKGMRVKGHTTEEEAKATIGLTPIEYG